MIDKHLCGCQHCSHWAHLEQTIRRRKQWEAIFTDGAPDQDTWLNAMDAESEARSAWLDHVLAYQQHGLLAQAA